MLVAAGTSPIIVSVVSAEDIMIMLRLVGIGLNGFKRKGACAHLNSMITGPRVNNAKDTSSDFLNDIGFSIMHQVSDGSPLKRDSKT